MSTKQTVADLLSQGRGVAESEASLRIEKASASAPGSDEPELITVILIMDPRDVEILDGKLIWEKRVLARTTLQAATKAGLHIDRRVF